MKCFYHNDADGRCSAAILDKFFEGFELIEIDYGRPFSPDIIETDERLAILDFSFSPDMMAKILGKTKDITWIDHHKTAMKYNYGVKLSGVRDIDKAACVLTWEWCANKRELPMAVKLIGDYDTWKFLYPETEKRTIFDWLVAGTCSSERPRTKPLYSYPAIAPQMKIISRLIRQPRQASRRTNRHLSRRRRDRSLPLGQCDGQWPSRRSDHRPPARFGGHARPG